MPINTNRRRMSTLCVLAPTLAGGLALSAVSAVAAETYPVRSIKWVVPYLAGTAPDTTARILADAVGSRLGQPVVIDNRGGVSGNIGARAAAAAAPDGYTWVYSASPMATNMRMYADPGYDALKDFQHILGIVSLDCVLIVAADSSIQSFADLVEQARAQPGKLDYSSGGVGSPSHLGMEMLLNALNIEAQHIPYKGATEIVTSVLGKQVTFGLPITSVAVPQIRSGRLRAFAVTGAARNAALPDVPSLTELGLEGVELVAWAGISVPAGVPDAVTKRIRSAFEEALTDPQVITKLEEAGNTVSIQDSATFTESFTKEIDFTEKMMTHLGLTPL